MTPIAPDLRGPPAYLAPACKPLTGRQVRPLQTAVAVDFVALV